ncbi:MAG TPA: DUF6356 family protein [Sphingomicrobium sp.]|jgi:hypothetical protein|nr:DUF6356 family protein [Sphingomicrobium sp.]
MIRSSKRHLADVGETYGEHLGAALGFSIKLVKASAACALHALVPALFTQTASRSVAELHSRLARRSALRRSERKEALQPGGFEERR